MPIDPRWVVNLKGKEYPTWPGVLDAAHRAGLTSLTTRVLQIPAEPNGWTAIVEARAEFADGRVFVELGDCSPKNVAPQIATAALRMAATRAKGRALRDAINCGQALLEELHEGDGGSELRHEPGSEGALPRGPLRAAPAAPPEKGLRRLKAEDRLRALRAEAQGHGLPVTAGDVEALTDAELERALREVESSLALVRAEEGAGTPAPRPPAAGPNACETCGLTLKPAQVALSRQKFRRTLCPEHQRAEVPS